MVAYTFSGDKATPFFGTATALVFRVSTLQISPPSLLCLFHQLDPTVHSSLP
jgi:hypothetical protein